MAYGFTYTLPTITGSHTDFPVLLRKDDFPSAAIDGGSSSILNGGGNLRAYTDDTKATRLPVDVEQFVAGGTPAAVVHIKVPAAATGNTIYIEADDTETTQPAVTNTYGRNAVWSDYAAVLHLNDSNYTDSTGNGYDGTLNGTSRSFTSAGHPWGLQWPDFASDANIVLTGSAAGMDNTPVTLSCWANPDVVIDNDGLLGNRYSTDDNRWIQLQSNRKVFSKNTGSENLAETTGRSTATTVHVVATQDSSALRLYDDAVEVASDTTVDSGESIDYQYDFRIGTYYDDASFRRYNGRVGEVRLRPSALSADWISTEYDNQSASGAWGTVGAWADGGGGVTGSGGLSSQSSSLSGSGAVARDATGALSSQASTVSGSGSIGRSGSGALSSQAAAISGTGIITKTGSGSLLAQASAVAASGTVTPASSVTGTGALSAQESQVSGSGVIGRSGSGFLSAQSSSISGTGVIGRTGSGALSSQSSSISGVGTIPNTITGSGALICAACEISGIAIKSGWSDVPPSSSSWTAATSETTSWSDVTEASTTWTTQ